MTRASASLNSQRSGRFRMAHAPSESARLQPFIDDVFAGKENGNMRCWICDRPAVAVCVFCGRGVCKDHAKEHPHVLAVYRNKRDQLRALVTPDAIYCGECKPKEHPVDIGEIDAE